MEETALFFNDTAVKLAMDGEHNEAIACLRRGLQIDPHNSLLWFNLGLSYYGLNRKDDSYHALVQAAKCNPGDADIWDILGVVLYEIGEIAASYIAYDKALELEITNGRIWNNYGTLLFNDQKYDKARHAFESAITLRPESYDTLFNLRDTYIELGETRLAEKCNRMLNDTPEESRIHKGSV